MQARLGDAGVTLYLELEGPINDRERATVTALHDIDDCMMPTKTVAYISSIANTATSSEAEESCFTGDVPSRVISLTSAAVHEQQNRLGLRRIVTTSTNQLPACPNGNPDSTSTSKGDMVNLYSVIIDCRSPCRTNRTKFRREVVIAEESCVQESDSTTTLKTMAIYCEEDNPSKSVPFRCVGDIIRAHRIHLGSQDRDRFSIDGVFVESRCYSTVLLWANEGNDFFPKAPKDPAECREQGLPLQVMLGIRFP